MTIQIPSEYAPNFGKFFENFDRDLAKIGIESYGITISTLEEVFLKVGNLTDHATPGLIEDDAKKQKDLENPQVSETFSFKENASEINTGFFNNLGAVMYSRFNNYKRNK
jgi:hypothetical protein